MYYKPQYERDSRNRRDFGSGFDRKSQSPRFSPSPPISSDSSSRHGDGDQKPREPPKERVKLDLKPRTKPINEDDLNKPATDSSIFGGARPVDTAKQDRIIEARLEKEQEELHSDSSSTKTSSLSGRRPSRPRFIEHQKK